MSNAMRRGTWRRHESVRSGDAPPKEALQSMDHDDKARPKGATLRALGKSASLGKKLRFHFLVTLATSVLAMSAPIGASEIPAPTPFIEFALPTVGMSPGPIAIDADGNVWFAAEAGQKIGELRSSGRFRLIELAPTRSQIQDITTTADGCVWFTETWTYDGSVNRIGRIAPDGLTNMQSEKLGFFGNADPQPRPVIPPLNPVAQGIVAAWRTHLKPREHYNMSTVTPDTLTIAGTYAVVGWSDLDGDAATLLHNVRGHWVPIATTNGNVRVLGDLTAIGVPRGIASRLVLDSNVILIPGSEKDRRF